MTLSQTPSWNGWHNIYRAAHQLNLLEPGIMLLANRVPHFLQRCEDNIYIPYCLHNILCIYVWGLQAKALNYPKHLLVTTNADMKSDAVMASNWPLESLSESVDNFTGPSSHMLPMPVTIDTIPPSLPPSLKKVCKTLLVTVTIVSPNLLLNDCCFKIIVDTRKITENFHMTKVTFLHHFCR